MKRLHIEHLCYQNMGPFSLAAEPSECVGLIGPSGVGKTLFLRAVADLDPHTGQVFLNGCEAAGMPAHEWRRKVGFLPAESAWWFDTVGEHFLHEKPGEMAFLGFSPDIMNREVSRLSRGERQRLALVRLLSNRPEVLLLDEPTANLDAENEQKVERLVKEYIRNFSPAVLWVSHDAEQVRRVADRCFRVSQNALEPVPEGQW